MSLPTILYFGVLIKINSYMNKLMKNLRIDFKIWFRSKKFLFVIFSFLQFYSKLISTVFFVPPENILRKSISIDLVLKL